MYPYVLKIPQHFGQGQQEAWRKEVKSNNIVLSPSAHEGYKQYYTWAALT